MKKELIKVGDKLAWDGQVANVAVTVVDVDLKGNNIGIIDGNITHVIDSCHLAPMPIPTTSSFTTNILDSVVKKNLQRNGLAPVKSTKPNITTSYDEEIHSLFIVINDKTTVCVPNVTPGLIDAIGISYKHDGDHYNSEIGNALAFYRSKCNEGKSDEEEFGSLFPFIGL